MSSTSMAGRARLVLAALTSGALVATAAAVFTGSLEALAGTPGSVVLGTSTVSLNQATDPGLGRLTPEPTADTAGMFGPQLSWPLVPIHVGLSRQGSLLSYGTPFGQPIQEGMSYDQWDPTADTHAQTASMHDYNSFCSSSVTLPDGRIMMVGGNSTTSSMVFDPVTRQQSMGSAMAEQRWYGTALRLPDNRVMILGGGDYYAFRAFDNPDNNDVVATTPEISNGTGSWSALTGATSLMAFGARDNRWWYPRAFNAPDGTVVGTSNDQIWKLSTGGSGSISQLGTLPVKPGVSGSQVMYAPGRILIAGGGEVANGIGGIGLSAANVLDVRNGAQVTATGSMANPRNWLNLTVLPDGKVLANGGTRVGVDQGVYPVEMWNPATGRWTVGDSAQRIRTYHSSSILLPSGAVFTGGGGVPGPEDNLNAEIYYPPSLFTRGADGVVRWADRPAIATLSGPGGYGGSLTLGMSDNRTISAVSMISMSSVTHSVNTDQRRIPLSFTQSGATVRATVNSDVNQLVPGDYQLTVVDSKGVPSPGQVITVTASGAWSVTVGKGTDVPPAGTGVAAPLKSTSSVPASFSQSGSRLTLSAAGADIWTGVDEYAAVYNPASAAVGSSVTARVDSQTNTDPWAKAGVLLRNRADVARTSPGYAVMVLTPGNGVSFQWDSNGNGDLDAYATARPGASAPMWVRLTRVSATRVAGYYSTNGTTWIQVGATVTVPGAVTRQDAGVVMTSHKPGTRGTAVFSSLTVR